MTLQVNCTILACQNGKDNTKQTYSLCQFLVGYFEQMISIWYFFSKNLDSKNFLNLLYSQPHNKSISILLEDSDRVLNFLKKEFPENDKRKLLEEINYKSISQEMRKDQSIKDMVKEKKKVIDLVHLNIYNGKYCHFHDRQTTLEILDEIETRVRKEYFYSQTTEEFVESLLFTPIGKMFFYDDFFCKQFWIEIHNLYTRRNALELINEEICENKVESNRMVRKKSNNSGSSPRKKSLISNEGGQKKKKRLV